jgi:hypothetical protein
VAWLMRIAGGSSTRPMLRGPSIYHSYIYSRFRSKQSCARAWARLSAPGRLRMTAMGRRASRHFATRPDRPARKHVQHSAPQTGHLKPLAPTLSVRLDLRLIDGREIQ